VLRLGTQEPRCAKRGDREEVVGWGLRPLRFLLPPLGLVVQQRPSVRESRTVGADRRRGIIGQFFAGSRRGSTQVLDITGTGMKPFRNGYPNR